MVASSSGLADVIYSEVCDFSYPGGAYGLSQHYKHLYSKPFIISDRTKDPTVHLRRLLENTENSYIGEFAEGFLIRIWNSTIYSDTHIKMS